MLFFSSCSASLRAAHSRSLYHQAERLRGASDMSHRLLAFAGSFTFNRPNQRTLSSAQRAPFSRESRIAGNAAVWARISVRGPAIMGLDPPQAQIMDGKAVAKEVRREIALRVKGLVERGAQPPGLAVIIVGERKDSMTYVRGKRKACDEVGINSFGFELPEDCTQERLESLVEELNNREDVHGILVQLPLPSHIDDEKVLNRIKLEKDVDGFHPLNIGRLCMSGRTPPVFIPCTPKGCIELLDRHGVQIDGKNAVVLGRSNIVGLPVAMLLLHRNATLTICHSRTKDVENKVREADILIAACGIPNYVQGDWLKENAVVVDVGINAVEDATKKRGYRLVGDVDAAGAASRASLISPVPGGVGPMTIAMLLSNTLDACVRATTDAAADATAAVTAGVTAGASASS